MASALFILGLVFFLGFVWTFSGLWFEQKDTRRKAGARLLSRLATIKPQATLSKVKMRDWVLILAVSVLTAIFTRLPVLTVGSALILYLTRAFFGKDPMEARLQTMEDNIAWMQSLTYLLQTSKSAWESLLISTKALPESTAKELQSALSKTNGNLGGYTIRLRDALTLFAIQKADPQIDVIVAMVNANITSSGSQTDFAVMHAIQEQLKAELTEQSAAVAARRELFTIAKIMFPTVVVMESALTVMMGNFILPYYQTIGGLLVSIIVEVLTVGLLVLFRKFSAPLAETRLIVPETFAATIKRQAALASQNSEINLEGIQR